MNFKLLKYIQNPWWFSFFLLLKLPIGLLSGLKLMEATPEKVVVRIRYKYITKNPFRSIYFGCLAMAAELASGTLGIINTMGIKPEVSMLIVHMEADFLKKAKGKVYFTCTEGEMIRNAIHETKTNGLPQKVVATSIGIDENGNEIAKFKITWSFKVKNT